MGREDQEEEKETLKSIFPDELTGNLRFTLLKNYVFLIFYIIIIIIALQISPMTPTESQ